MTDHISVDGEQVALPAGRHSIVDILKASGFSAPNRFDLIRVDHDGRHVNTHRVGEMAELADQDQFITARISTTTA